MNTLFDFISEANGIQYALALIFMFGFVVFSEVLKPKPFDGLVRAAAEDIRHIRIGGKLKAAGLAKAIILAPFYAVFYVASVPVLFVHGIAVLFGRLIIVTSSIGWSPARAYFATRAKRKKIAVHKTD